MTDTRLISNKRVKVLVTTDTGIADWDAGPTLAESAAMLDISGAINWDAYDLNIQASDSADDRTLTDAAGSKSRSADAFGGNLEMVQPKPDDLASIFRQAYNVFKGDRTKLAIVVRVGPLNSAPTAAGDVVNAYRLLADAQSTVRADSNRPSYAYTVNLLAQDDVAVNAIIPSAVPKAVALTPAGTADCDVDGTVFFKALYEGVNVTIGADYVSSDPTVLLVTPHGIGIGLKAGTANVTASYPGSAAGLPVSVVVAAP